MNVDEVIVEFGSKATAPGVVRVQLGFIPDFVELFSDYAGTPARYTWANPSKFPNWPSANSVKHLTAGLTAVPGTLIAAFTGGGDGIGVTAQNPDGANETANSDPKHVDLLGNPGVAKAIPRAGVEIAVGAQTQSGRNLLIARRYNAR